MKRKYEEQEGILHGDASGGKSARKPRKSSGIRVQVSSIVQGGSLIPVVTTPQGIVRKEPQHLYGSTVGQNMHNSYGMMTTGYPQQPQVQYHRQPMTTWNPPVYSANQPQHQETVAWSGIQNFKQETFKVEPQEPIPEPQYPQHNNENHHPQQQQQQQQQSQHQEPEFQHLFSPLK